MTSPQNPAPQSKASLAIVKVKDKIGDVDALIKNVRPPVAGLGVDLALLDSKFIAPGLQLCEDIIGVCDSLRDALKFCKLLQPIPILGQLVGRVASVIQNMQIDTKVKELVEKIKNAFLKVRNETVGRIKNACNTIGDRLDKVADMLPSWRQALDIMVNMLGVIDLGVYVFFDKDSKDPVVETGMGSLEQMSIGLSKPVETLFGALKPLQDFGGSEALRKFKEAVAGPLKDGLGDFPNKIHDLKNSVDPFVNTLRNIMGKLGPVYDLLNGIALIVDKLIGPLVNGIIDNTPLRGLVDDVSRKIQNALGVDDLKRQVTEVLDSALGNLQSTLDNINNQTQALLSGKDEFEKSLKDFRQHPAGKLFAIVSQGLKIKYPQLFQPISGTGPAPIQHRMMMKHTANVNNPKHEVGREDQNSVRPIEADVPVEPGWDLVQQRLQMMDSFIIGELEDDGPVASDLGPVANGIAAAVTGNNSTIILDDDCKETASRSIPSASTAAVQPENEDTAPKLAYARFHGTPVSVLMRVVQEPILQKQADARTEALAPMSSTLGVQLAHLSMRTATAAVVHDTVKSAGTTSPSGGKAPKLDAFILKVADLSSAMAKVKAYIGRISAAAQQADADFSAFEPEATHFGEQLTKLVEQLNPMFTASSNLLELPNKYRTALSKTLGEILVEMGTQDWNKVSDTVSTLFATLDKADAVLQEVREHVKKVSQQSTNISTAFKASYEHAKQICSPSRFPNTLGTGVSSLTTLVNALQSRLDAAAGCLATLAQIGEIIVQQHDKLANNEGVFAKLDVLYGRLGPLVEATTAEAQLLPPLVDALYSSLSDVHGDVRTFFQATKIVADLCKVAEQQVVGADVFRGMCSRVNNAVAPFESLLEQLQVHKDAPLHNKKIILPPATNSTIAPPSTQASIAAQMKAANDALGGKPMDILQKFLVLNLVPAMGQMLDKFLGVGDIEAQLTKLGTSLQTPLTSHLDAFEKALNNLIKVVEPKAGGAGDNTNAILTNPLLDEASSKALVSIANEINTIVIDATKA